MNRLIVTAAALLAATIAQGATLKVALVSDGSVPVETMQDALSEANRIYAQLGVQIVAESTKVIDDAPTHTNPNALLQDFRTQVSTGPDATTTTVLFTARTLNIGSVLFAGRATTGPACSAWAVAIVSTNESGGSSGYTLAHELGHTLGLEHDDAPGYVMSPDERGTDVFSPQSVAQFKGQFTDCLADPVQTKPAAIVQAAPSSAAPASSPAAPSKGGGGAMGLGLVAALLMLKRARG